jgi:hypothetical protein
MGLKSREIYVWLISLVLVLLVYLLYSKISQTPRIDIDRGTGTLADSNVGQLDSEVGMIGEVGVGTVRKAKYIHLNEKKEIDRVFGFEKLLHKEGNEWAIEKPYMDIFWPDFKCSIKADRGKVRVETAAGRVSPQDATLKENVVIHILPGDSDDSKEGFLYLDEVVFISERSLFSTDGPVWFVSSDAHMQGTGLELVYNNQRGRLEFLRIINLESLRLSNWQAGLFSGTTEDSRGSAKTAELPTEYGGQKAKPSPEAGTEAVKHETGKYYRCVFNGNVVIDTAEQLILADQLSINNICWSKSSGEKSPKKVELAEGGTRHEERGTKDEERGMEDEQLVEVVVTCDKGVVLAPMDSARVNEEFTEVDSEVAVIEANGPWDFNDSSGKATFVAGRIDHDASTGDTVASGISELTFYINDVMGAEGEEAAIPVQITAQEKVKFSPAMNQVVFAGDTVCAMERVDAHSQQRYKLSTPKLAVDLVKDEDKLSSNLTTDVEHITASGGVVKISTVKTAGEKLLGGVELKCWKFDYDASQQLFCATGPGLIKVNNSNISESKVKVGKLSLRRRCIAVLRKFETLKYFSELNRIVADAGSERIVIDYFPIEQGRQSEHISTAANHIEAVLYETEGGRTELSWLAAVGGITYEDEDNHFEGSEMFYNAKEGIITVWGDEDEPCFLNGAVVDGIKYDLTTGRVKAEVVGPGALQLER